MSESFIDNAFNKVFGSSFTSFNTIGGDEPVGQLKKFPANKQILKLIRIFKVKSTESITTNKIVMTNIVNPNKRLVSVFIENCDLGDGLTVYVFCVFK